MKILGAAAMVACVALGACTPGTIPFGGGGFGGTTAVAVPAPAPAAFPADLFRGTAKTCAEGIRVAFANDITPTSLTVNVVLGFGVLAFTANGGPFVFQGRGAGFGIILEFAANYSTFDVTVTPDGGAQIYGNACS